jgi:hypothetical protein
MRRTNINADVKYKAVKEEFVMRYVWKIALVLLLTVFIGSADAATEWVKLYRSDRAEPEWIQIVTDRGKGQVVAVYDNSFIIDIGMGEGARESGKYLVYSERTPRRGKEPLAVLEVIQTAEKFSVCDMTPYVSGGLIHVGDFVAPVAMTANNTLAYPAAVVAAPAAVVAAPVAAVPAAKMEPVVALPATVTVTEGYVSQNGPYDKPIPAIYTAPAAPSVPTQVAPAAYMEPAQYNYQPVGAPQQPAYSYPQASPQSPFPGNVSYPPHPNYPNTRQTQLDFDANKIADARLIRTMPLSQADMNALEIQFRGASDLFAARKYHEAFESFMRQSSFQGNYLSPYWAGMSALRLGDRQTAINLFNDSLSINPYYEPARHGVEIANGNVQPEAPKQQPAKRGSTKRK